MVALLKNGSVRIARDEKLLGGEGEKLNEDDDGCRKAEERRDQSDWILNSLIENGDKCQGEMKEKRDWK